MKLKINKNMTYDEADKLIERYYDGLTDVEEEKRLQAFLSQTGLPERYKAEQAIFGYFDVRKQKAKIFTIKPYLQWVGSAAAVLLIAFGIQFFGNVSTSYAYVDGVKITNVREIKAQALASITEVKGDNDEIETSLNAVSGNEIVKQQLDVFSGLGE